MNFDENELEEILRKAKKGDEDAFQILYVKYFKLVYYISFKYTNSKQDAEDLAQEAFMKAFKKIYTLKSAKAFVNWIATITTNTFFSQHRSRNAKKNFREEINIDNAEYMDLKEDDINLPDSILEQKQKKELIRDLINRLPFKQRTVLFLYYFQEFSVKEIASMHDSTEGSIKNALCKGRQSLKKEIEKEFNIKEAPYQEFFGIGPIITLVMREEFTAITIDSEVVDKIWLSVIGSIKGYLMFLGLKSQVFSIPTAALSLTTVAVGLTAMGFALSNDQKADVGIESIGASVAIETPEEKGLEEIEIIKSIETIEPSTIEETVEEVNALDDPASEEEPVVTSIYDLMSAEDINFLNECVANPTYDKLPRFRELLYYYDFKIASDGRDVRYGGVSLHGCYHYGLGIVIAYSVNELEENWNINYKVVDEETYYGMEEAYTMLGYEL